MQIVNKKIGYVYILSNKNRTVLYVGVTSDLKGRMKKHRTGFYPDSFSKRYNVTELLYYEVFEKIGDAVKREKQLKNWHRDWKWNLIKEMNPKLVDLYPALIEGTDC